MTPNTVAIEAALREASATLWQTLGHAAAGTCLPTDYYDPARCIIAAYLRLTGRGDEAREVGAIGCNEGAPVTGFAGVREWMEGRGAQ